MFDLSTTAGLYSQIAGILAGFAFTALLIPLTVVTSGTRSREIGHAITAFTCAFFGLILSAVLYAVMAGEPSDPTLRGRATVEELSNGTAFSLSALLLLYGLYRLLVGHEAEKAEFRLAGRVMLLVVGILGPLVILALLWSGAEDVANFRETVQSPSPNGPPLAWSSAANAIFALSAAYLLCIALMFRAGRTWKWAQSNRDSLPIGVLGVSVVTAIGVSVFSAIASSDVVTPEPIQNLLFAAAAIAVCLFSSSTVLSRGF